MVRKDWLNLNGLWEYAIRPAGRGAAGERSTGEILVPFPVESALSGVMKRVGRRQRLWYRRTFEVPAGWNGKRVLLHFGAVDWEATVWVNGKEVGEHRAATTRSRSTSPTPSRPRRPAGAGRRRLGPDRHGAPSRAASRC